jgi:hypothetical protein
MEHALLFTFQFIRRSAALCSTLQSLKAIAATGLRGAGIWHTQVSDTGCFYTMTDDNTCPSTHIEVVEMDKGVRTSTYELTLMTATDWRFMLTDTWFRDDVIYVMQWGTSVFIGFGSQIYTAEEAAMSRELLALSDWLRGKGRVGCLVPAVAPVQEFSADRFTQSFCDAAYRHLVNALALPCEKVDGDSTGIAVDK